AALARVDPAKGVDTVKRDVTLEPCWTFTAKVLGPAGEPLLGARRFSSPDRKETKTAEFRISAINPRRPRDVFFQHLEKGLVGVAIHPKENGTTGTVGTEPGPTITGRLVNEKGQPQAGVDLEVGFRPNKEPDGPKGERYFTGYSPGTLQTDRDGRFRLEALP